MREGGCGWGHPQNQAGPSQGPDGAFPLQERTCHALRSPGSPAGNAVHRILVLAELELKEPAGRRAAPASPCFLSQSGNQGFKNLGAQADELWNPMPASLRCQPGDPRRSSMPHVSHVGWAGPGSCVSQCHDPSLCTGLQTQCGLLLTSDPSDLSNSKGNAPTPGWKHLLLLNGRIQRVCPALCLAPALLGTTCSTLQEAQTLPSTSGVPGENQGIQQILCGPAAGHMRSV